MPMEMCIKDNGLMTKQMAMEYTGISTDPNLKVTGKMTNNKGMDNKNGKINLNSLASIKMGKSNGKASFYGVMAPNSKGNFIITIFMDLEYTFGATVENTKGTGRKIRCMARESLLGQMGNLIKEITLKTKNKGMELLFGLMAGCTLDSGKMESSMEKGNIKIHIIKSKRDYGLMEKLLNGMIK